MGRLGIQLRDARDVVSKLATLPHVEIEGIFSHFPNAYAENDEGTRRQVADFVSLIHDLEARGIHIPKRHIANSDGIQNVAEAHLPPFNHVRTGINLHGLFDDEGARTVDLRPVAALRTRLVSIRRLPAGTSIGYGRTCVLERETLVGVVAAGYADGMPLALSNHGRILLRGRACPVLGRISMDYTTLSLEAVPDAQVGDIATCIGRDGDLEIGVNEWAHLKNTHPYEVICGFGNRVQRHYHPLHA
jgi:alanine racemase